MNQHVPNKNANLLKKISLMGTELRGAPYSSVTTSLPVIILLRSRTIKGKKAFNAIVPLNTSQEYPWLRILLMTIKCTIWKFDYLLHTAFYIVESSISKLVF